MNYTETPCEVNKSTPPTPWASRTRDEKGLLRVNYITPARPGKRLEPLNFNKVSGASVTLDTI